jgi:hypothetical protein
MNKREKEGGGEGRGLQALRLADVAGSTGQTGWGQLFTMSVWRVVACDRTGHPARGRLVEVGL